MSACKEKQKETKNLCNEALPDLATKGMLI